MFPQRACATKNDDIIANESEDAPPRRRRRRRQPLVCRFVLRALFPRPRETERRERRENEELSLLRFTFSPRDSSLSLTSMSGTKEESDDKFLIWPQLKATNTSSFLTVIRRVFKQRLDLAVGRSRSKENDMVEYTIYRTKRRCN